MAKRLKPVEPEVERYSKGDDVLIASNAFIYSVDTFIIGFRSYHLEDSKTVKVKELKLDKLKTCTKIKNQLVIIEYQLIAAPKTWLQTNNYTFIT